MTRSPTGRYRRKLRLGRPVSSSPAVGLLPIPGGGNSPSSPSSDMGYRSRLCAVVRCCWFIICGRFDLGGDRLPPKPECGGGGPRPPAPIPGSIIIRGPLCPSIIALGLAVGRLSVGHPDYFGIVRCEMENAVFVARVSAASERARYKKNKQQRERTTRREEIRRGIRSLSLSLSLSLRNHRKKKRKRST